MHVFFRIIVVLRIPPCSGAFSADHLILIFNLAQVFTLDAPHDPTILSRLVTSP